MCCELGGTLQQLDRNAIYITEPQDATLEEIKWCAINKTYLLSNTNAYINLLNAYIHTYIHTYINANLQELRIESTLNGSLDFRSQCSHIHIVSVDDKK